jgi:hypothetical protein
VKNAQAHMSEMQMLSAGTASGAGCDVPTGDQGESETPAMPGVIELARLQFHQHRTGSMSTSAECGKHEDQHHSATPNAESDCSLLGAPPGKLAAQETECCLSPETSALALRTLARFKIVLHSGDLTKRLTSRKKFKNAFGAVTVGNRHVHHLKKDSCLAAVMRPGALVAVESARNLVQMKAEHVTKFETAVGEWAVDGGFREFERVPLPKGHLCFEFPDDEVVPSGG